MGLQINSLMVLLLAQHMLNTEEIARSEQRLSSSISEHSSALQLQELKRDGSLYLVDEDGHSLLL
jgi:hypothetical protein